MPDCAVHYLKNLSMPQLQKFQFITAILSSAFWKAQREVGNQLVKFFEIVTEFNIGLERQRLQQEPKRRVCGCGGV